MHTRTELLIGKESLEKLKKSHVMVVGLGGVGAYSAEMLVRAGIGKITIVDGDIVNQSNKNRQLIALDSTQGKEKTEVLAKRLKDINKDLEIIEVNQFIRDEFMIELLKRDKYDFIVDAIDTLSPKLYLIIHSLTLNIPIISSMGSGGKFDPTQVKVSDISKSYNCSLASALRKKLHKMGVYSGFSVVYSSEKVSEHVVVEDKGQNKRSTVGTISYMPPIFGCMCASVVIRELIGMESYPKSSDYRFYANKKEKPLILYDNKNE